MGRRAAFHTLGCKVNAYETEAMEELLQTAGYDIVPFTEYGGAKIKTDAAPRKKINSRGCCGGDRLLCAGK